jgi:hypothetical protein
MQESPALQSPSLTYSDVVDVEPPLVSPESAANFDNAEIRRIGQIMLLSLTAFLVAGWFISRSYVMTLFIIGGFAQVTYKLAKKAGMIPSEMNWTALLKTTLTTTFSLLILVYIILRVSNLSR